MAVVDYLSVQIATNAAKAAADMAKYGKQTALVGSVATAAAEPVKVVGESLQVIGSEHSKLAKAGAALRVVGTSLALVSATGATGRHVGIGLTLANMIRLGNASRQTAPLLSGVFRWILRIGSMFIPGGAAIKILAGAATLFGLLQVAKAVRRLGQEIRDMVGRYEELSRVSRKLNVGSDQLIALRHAAEISAGMMAGQFDTALQRMVRRVAEASHGTGEAVKALREMGLNAQEMARLAPDQQFLAIASAMREIGNQGDRVRLAMKIFDTEGVDLVNTLALGPVGLRQLAADMKRYGVTPTLEAQQAAAKYAEEVARTKILWQGVGDSFYRSMLPVMKLWEDIKQSAANVTRMTTNLLSGALGEILKGPGWSPDHLLKSKSPAPVTPTNLPTAATYMQFMPQPATPLLAARTGDSADTHAAARRNLRGGRSPLDAVAKNTKKAAELLADLVQKDTTPPVYSMGGAG